MKKTENWKLDNPDLSLSNMFDANEDEDEDDADDDDDDDDDEANCVVHDVATF